MQNKAVTVLLMLLMNTAQGLLTFSAFKQGSTGFIVCSVVGFVVTNMLAFLGSPIAVKATDDEHPKMILPGEIAKVVLPFLFVGALLTSGCATAGGKAWTACELGKLPAMGQVAFATAHDIADNQSSTASDLTTAALALAPGQFECAAKALLAWLGGLADKPAPDGASGMQALLAASTASVHDHARAVLRAYLKGKSTSCAPARYGLADPAQLRERPRVTVALLEPCEDAETCREIVIDDAFPVSVRR